MRSEVYSYVTSMITLTLVAVAFSTPLIFLDLTTNFFDIPKLIFLVVATLVLHGLWVVSWVVRGKVVITKTPLDIPLIILLIFILSSAFFSASRYPSVFGVFPEVHGSAVSWATYIFLYFVAVSNLNGEGKIKLFLYAFLVSAAIISLVSIFSFFGVFLPFEMAKSLNFTPAGSTFSTTSFLLMLLPLTLISAAKRNKFLPTSLAAILSILYAVTVALIGSMASYVLLFMIFAGSLFVVKDHLSDRNLLMILSPFASSVLVVVLVLAPFTGNPLYEGRNNFPQEIKLPLDISWKVSASAFRDAPFLGTGTGTYLYNFTNYKPVEFNRLDFWNFTFSSATNEVLQAMATWGLLGTLVLIAFGGVVLLYTKNYLLPKTSNYEGASITIPVQGLAISGMVAVAVLLIHASTLVSIVTMFLLLAAFMASQKSVNNKVSNISAGIKVSTSDKSKLDLLPLMALVVYLVVALFLINNTYKAVLADYYHRLALSQADSDGSKTYEYLQKAESLNPYIDLYRVDMAQTNFALANALASQKGPTEDNPQGTLTDQDKQTIQTLITQAISEGRASVVLAPRSSRNWEVLALIYRNITGVAENSLTFALDAYGRAIQMDPYNPTLRVNVGAVYYTAKNYDMAVRFFTDSINLKPDYINGYYNLAIALRDKGELDNAQLVAEQTVALLQESINKEGKSRTAELLRETQIKDYNTAVQLLNDIKEKKDSGVETEEETGLQNPDLPSIDVPNLENPPGTIEPPEVGENPEVDLPELTPSVTSTPTPNL
jgi:tetratricopeptide (TPR) repeat protein